MPSRRRFLVSAALASGFAGCTGGESGDPDGTTETTTTETTATETTTTTTSRETGTTTDETTTTYEPQKETPESEAVRWRVSFDDAIGTPVVGDDRVFVPLGEPHYGRDEESVGALAGLDAKDGTPEWTNRLPAAPTGSLHFDDGGVYCTTGTSDGIGLHGRDQRCLRFDPDGTERWRTSPVNQFLDVLALGDGRAYLATSDDALALDGQRLFAVGLSDGQTRWSVEIGDASEGEYRDGTVLAAVGGGKGVSVHDAASGERQWMKEGRALGPKSDPFPVTNGAVIVGVPSGQDGEFAALDVTDGSERWRYTSESESLVPTSAALAGETVVGTTYDGIVIGLDATDGTERWTLDAGERAGTPVVGDGTVYLSGSDGDSAALYALDPETGTERWRLDRGAIRPAGLVDDALVVSGVDAGREFVAAVSPTDGTEQWSFETYERLATPVVSDGTVLVTSERGIVRAISG
jgi:outer membrane protein assembly factor BamB